MPPSIPKMSTNAFNNSATLLGQLAQAINSTRTISAVVGGASALQVGTRVSIDTTVTTPGVVRVTACADAVAAFGVIIYSPQEDLIQVGDSCEVAYVGGNCMTQVGGTTLTPGTPVALSSGYLAAVDGSHVVMGLLIDYVTSGTSGRVILGWSAS